MKNIGVFDIDFMIKYSSDILQKY